jgi:hypothetical protein
VAVPTRAWLAILACTSVFAGASACVDVLGDFPQAKSDDGGAVDGTVGDSGHADTSITDSAKLDSTQPDTGEGDTSFSADTQATDTLVIAADTSTDAREDARETEADEAAMDAPGETSPESSLADTMQAQDTLEEPDAIVDSGSGMDAPTDSGSPVGSVPGLVLWLEANQGVTKAGGTVSQWNDQSGAGNNAVATGPSLPVTFTPSDFPNGLPGLTLGSPGATAGTWQILQVTDSPSLQLAPDFLIEIVVRANALGFGSVYEKQLPNTAPYSGIGMFLGNAAADGGPALMAWQIQLDENHNLFGDASFLGPGASDVGNWRIFGAQQQGALVSLRIDGQLNAQVNALTGSSTWQPTPASNQAPGEALGLGGSAGRYIFEMPMDIAEVIVVSGSVSAQNLANIEGYLATKYAIP